MFPKKPELAPDLEWMLKSNQVSDSLILETLLQETYSPVFRLALSILDDAEAAQRATIDTLRLAVRDKHRFRSDQPVKVWLFALAIKVCQRRLGSLRWLRAGRALLAPFKWTEAGRGVPPQTEQEAQLWLALDALPSKLSLPVKLETVLGLPEEEIAGCLQTPQKTVHGRLEKVYRRLSRSLALDRSSGEIKTFLTGSLSRRWPDPSLSDGPLGEIQPKVEKFSSLIKKNRQAMALQKVLLSALALLAILLIGWFSYVLYPDEEQVSLAMRTQKVVHSVRVTPTRPAKAAPTLPLVPPLRVSEGQGTEAGALEVTPDALSGLSPHRQIDLPPILITLYGKDSLNMWSNSGPILLSRVLDYWGVRTDPDQITRSLQPSSQDENVMPYELENYVQGQTGLKVIYRLGGDFSILAHLIQAGFLPILEKGYNGVYVDGWLGHYAIASGYDQTNGPRLLLTNTIDYEPRTRVRYADFQRDWQAFNYSYLVVYPEDREAELAKILGENIQAEYNYRQSYLKASQEISTSRSPLGQFYAWFNRGTSLTYLEDYLSAADSFDKAFSIYFDLPEKERPTRLLWYQSRPFWAYYFTGRYQDVIKLADATLEGMPSPVSEESLYWRALARAGLGDEQGAIADLKESLRLNPHFEAGAYQLQRLKGGS